MNIYITGIDGVLGTTLKEKLRSHGHDVAGCSLAHSPDPQIMRANVAERRQLAQSLDKGNYDILFHFAAEFGRINGQRYYEDLWRTNCIGTRNVIEECVTRNIKMVFASSSEAYGLSERYAGAAPLSEDMLDDHSPQFHNEYALSKFTNERQIFTACRNDNLNAVVLRFFNIYGPPERYSPYRSVVCQFAYKLLMGLPVTVNREGKRSHLWIGDWADTIARIVDNGDSLSFKQYWPGSQGTPHTPVFNIGGSEYETIEHLYNLLVDIIQPKNPNVIFVDKEEANSATKRPDNFMAETCLDHRPAMPLREGLIKTVDWMRREYGL